MNHKTNVINCMILLCSNSWVLFDLHSLPSDVAETVYSVGAQRHEGWGYLLDKYSHSLSEVEKDKILDALSNSKDSDKLSR